MFGPSLSDCFRDWCTSAVVVSLVPISLILFPKVGHLLSHICLKSCVCLMSVVRIWCILAVGEKTTDDYGISGRNLQGNLSMNQNKVWDYFSCPSGFHSHSVYNTSALIERSIALTAHDSALEKVLGFFKFCGVCGFGFFFFLLLNGPDWALI